MLMNRIIGLIAAALCTVLCGSLQANTYGSVEPIASSDVIDISPLSEQPLRVREAFALRLFECNIVGQVMTALSSVGAVTTINDLNTHVSVGAGGFAGRTNPSFVFTVIDNGPNAASFDDIRIMTDALGYVMSQSSAFLLDANDPFNFDFPANYLVLNFETPPSLRRSADVFRAVGRIDPELFVTDTSGFTQFGRAYLSLQSDVSNDRFIAGYARVALEEGLEYTPIVNGAPSLFVGGAAFPGNDWTVDTKGEEYLSRIPVAAHHALAKIRAFHLKATKEVLRKLERHSDYPLEDAASFSCR